MSGRTALCLFILVVSFFLGFGGFVPALAGLMRFLFIVYIVVTVISLIGDVRRGRRPVPTSRYGGRSR